MSDVAPNDPEVLESVIEDVIAIVDDLKSYLSSWAEGFDAAVTKLQNAAASRELPDGGVSGSVPESLSTESTTPSTGGGTTTPTGTSTVSGL